MKLLITILMVWISCSLVYGQTITVIDKTTRQSIPGVAIYTSDKQLSTTTNQKGQADISIFKNVDSVVFRHISYAEKTVAIKAFETKKYRIELTEKNIGLTEFVVSANRWEEEEKEVPSRIEKISAKEIAFQNPQTAADLLGAGGYVFIQKSQLAGGSPIIRGFATNRVMLVVDGVRMNNAIFRSGNVQNVISVDAGNVETAEILFGPGSVMYGSDAIGGVMDFHTLKLQFSDSSQHYFSGNAWGRYSTANEEKTGHFNFKFGTKRFALISSFSSSDFGDLRAGSDGNPYFQRPIYQTTINGRDTQLVNPNPQIQIASGYSQVNTMHKIGFKATENLLIDYSFYYSETSDAPRYDRLYAANAVGQLTFGEWYYGPQKWMMNRLGIIHSGTNIAYDQMRIIMAQQRYNESRHDRRFNNKRVRNQYEQVDAYSVNIDMDKKIGEKTSLFYGMEGVYNLVSSNSNRVHIETGELTPNNSRYPDGSVWQSYAGYFNLKHHVSKKWILNSGLRYSYFDINASFDTSLFKLPFTNAKIQNGSLNGSLGIVFNANEKIQIYANASTGFRAPNIDDIGKVFDSQPGAVVVPNSQLKPEHAYNGEIGTNLTLGNIAKLNVSGFYTYLDNALSRRPYLFNGQDSIMYEGVMSQVLAIQNISNAYVYGLQIGLDISLGYGFKLMNRFNYQYGEEYSADSASYYPLTHAAPMFGSHHLIYETRSLKFDFFVLYNGELSSDKISLNDRLDNLPFAKDANGNPYVAGWYTLNFKASWFINKNFVLNAGIENIEDKLYRPFASGISAPGRNIMLSLKIKF
jgi:hemoglobin/transferrin/lactoferrin receptor protein